MYIIYVVWLGRVPSQELANGNLILANPGLKAVFGTNHCEGETLKHFNQTKINS